MRLLLVVASVALGLFLSSPVLACGGCFSPPQTEDNSSFVTSHRMAFSISAQRTVLWDQFSYNGDPEDFSWVLPVKPGAYLEEADPAFLEVLDEATIQRVYAQPTFCGGGSSGCSGCLSATLPAIAPSGSAVSANGDAVQVVSQATVGPYETVILRSMDRRALQTWLEDNGYVVLPSIEPIIEQYVDEGFDFLALKLSPGKDVQQMTPVRVVTPGGDPILPLRMVAAGIAGEVEMTLFVIANSRRIIPDLENVHIGASELTWDYDTDSSNYADVLDAKLKENEGHVHLTSSAYDEPFEYVRRVQGGTVLLSGGATIDAAYFDGRCNSASRPYDLMERVVSRCGDERCDRSLIEIPQASDPGGGGAGGADGAEPDADGLGGASANQPATWSGHFVYGDRTDIEAALIGHRPFETWITRLDMRLPLSALERDCAIVDAEDQTRVVPVIVAEGMENHPCPPSRQGAIPAGMGKLPGVPPWLLSLGLVAAWFCRRAVRGVR